MSRKSDTLTIPKKLQKDDFVTNATHAESVRQLVEQKKREYEDVQQRIAVAKSQLRKLQDNLVQTENDFNSKIKEEKLKFQQERDEKLNDLELRNTNMQRGEEDLNNRIRDLQEREADNAKIDEERKQVMNLRIEYEKNKNQAELELTKAQALKDKNQTDIENLANKEVQVDGQLKEAKQQLANAEYIKNKTEEEKKDVLTQLSNLKALRSELEPEIKKLEELKAINKKLLSDAEHKDNEANIKIEEDKKLIKSMEEREQRIRAREVAVSSKEEDVARRELMLTNKK